MLAEDRESVEWLLSQIERTAEKEAARNSELSQRMLRDCAVSAGMAETLRGPDLALFQAVAANPTSPPPSGGA